MASNTDKPPKPGDNQLTAYAADLRTFTEGAKAADVETRRKYWLPACNTLRAARDGMPNNQEFGKWVTANKINEMYGLETNSTISDFIWVARNPEAVALVRPEVASPSSIRTEWRDLVRREGEERVKLLLDDVSEEILEATAKQLARDFHADSKSTVKILETIKGLKPTSHPAALPADQVSTDQEKPAEPAPAPAHPQAKRRSNRRVTANPNLRAVKAAEVVGAAVKAEEDVTPEEALLNEVLAVVKKRTYAAVKPVMKQKFLDLIEECRRDEATTKEDLRADDRATEHVPDATEGGGIPDAAGATDPAENHGEPSLHGDGTGVPTLGSLDDLSS